MREYILCSAIWYKNVPRAKILPININEGVVVCGRRHGDCISTLKALTGYRSVTYAIDGIGEFKEGFITNTGKFVNRQEALKIASEADQIIRPNESKELYSEDLY